MFPGFVKIAVPCAFAPRIPTDRRAPGFRLRPPGVAVRRRGRRVIGDWRGRGLRGVSRAWLGGAGAADEGSENMQFQRVCRNGGHAQGSPPSSCRSPCVARCSRAQKVPLTRATGQPPGTSGPVLRPGQRRGVGRTVRPPSPTHTGHCGPPGPSGSRRLFPSRGARPELPRGRPAAQGSLLPGDVGRAGTHQRGLPHDPRPTSLQTVRPFLRAGSGAGSCGLPGGFIRAYSQAHSTWPGKVHLPSSNQESACPSPPAAPQGPRVGVQEGETDPDCSPQPGL